MPLFEFDLMPVEEIHPWGTQGDLSLSWFALTLGQFRMPVGDQVLYRYKKGAFPDLPDLPDADYQIASIARDMFDAAEAALAPIPPFFEQIASNMELFDRLQSTPMDPDNDDESDWEYTAWRWLGERSPTTGYFVAYPEIAFIRIADRIHIRWDNRDRQVDGRTIWEASHGSHEMSVATFTAECHDFANRLLAAMSERISSIEAGRSRPQVPVSIDSLREQHENWRQELTLNFRKKTPDISWEDAERAVRRAAVICGVSLPAAI